MSELWTKRPDAVAATSTSWCRDEICESSEVLGGGREVKLVASAAWILQSETPEAEDAFEVGKEHLDLLPELAGD